MDEDKKIKLDPNSIISKITERLDEKMRRAFSWIHTEEGKIVVKAIQSLASYAVGDPTGIAIPLIFDSADDLIRKKLLKNFPDLMNRLEKVKPIIDKEFVKSDIGQTLLRETLSKMIKEENENKIEYHKRFLINCYVRTDADKQRILTFMRILSSLEPPQLQILGSFLNSQETINKIIDTVKNNRGEIIDLLLKREIMRLLGIDDQLFERSVIKLESENLINTKGVEAGWYSGFHQKGFENDARRSMLGMLNRLFTDFGKDFVKYVMTETQV